MLLRHLRYVTALARERHFARAAATCDVSQPALSVAIRQLEEELGVAIVERGNRFIGFTREGEFVLAWARRTLAEHDVLLQQIDANTRPLRGRLRLGIIPSVVPVMPDLSARFTLAHPDVVIAERSLTSIEIVRELRDFELDVALTYLDGEPLGNVRSLPLFHERYVLVTQRGAAFAGASAVRWRDAATLRLCLPDPGMQNRRILDAAFAQAGVEPAVGLVTNSIAAACGYVGHGSWSSIVPEAFVPWFGADSIAVFPLVEPEISKSIGLIAPEHLPHPPLADAFWSAAVDWQRIRIR